MKKSSALVAALLAALLAPAAARAQPETYFEHKGFKREGFFFGVMAQGGAFLSTSCCEIGGKRGGAGFALRLGTVATEDLLWVVQFEGAAVPVEDPVSGDTKLNRHQTATVGGVYYPLGTLWLHAGIGFATYRIDATVEETRTIDLERSGFAFATSAGFDILRWADAWSFGFSRQDLALSFEVHVVGGLYPGGKPVRGLDDTDQETGGILQITSGVGLQWY